MELKAVLNPKHALLSRAKNLKRGTQLYIADTASGFTGWGLVAPVPVWHRQLLARLRRSF